MPSELTPKQQFTELVRNAGSVLLLTHERPDGDALGSLIALKKGLEKLGKEVTAAISGPAPEFLSFLPYLDEVETEFTVKKDLLVIVDETQAKVGNVTLKRMADTKLAVIISPKDGFLTPTDIRIEDGAFNTDLVICLDAAELERVGEIYEQNPNLFFEVPVVNIDHHASNTNFGKVNIVDITASSTSELLVSLLEALGKDTPGMIDADIATCLLTGITTDTSSFQNANTTPKSLTVAAQLVAAGGRQQEIVKHIYKTRSLAQLRLWGRALSYIKEDSDLRFAWSILTKADFVASQFSQDESPKGVIDELLKTAANTDFVFLLYESDGGINGSFRSVNPTVDVSDLARVFGGGGHPQAAAFHIENATIAEKEQEIVNQIRQHLQGTGRRNRSEKHTA